MNLKRIQMRKKYASAAVKLSIVQKKELFPISFISLNIKNHRQKAILYTK